MWAEELARSLPWAWLITAQAFSCFAMFGVIWLVQLLVYPNFRLLPAGSFDAFHRFHSYRTTIVVGPLMLAEIVSALLLFLRADERFFLWNFASVFLLWLLTTFVSVPLHRRLELAPESEKKWVIHTNWFRTLVWTGRAAAWVYVMQAGGCGG